MDPLVVYAIIAVIGITAIVVPVLCVLLYIFGFYMYITSFFVRSKEEERKRRKHRKGGSYRHPEAVVVRGDGHKAKKKAPAVQLPKSESSSASKESTEERHKDGSRNNGRKKTSIESSGKPSKNQSSKAGGRGYGKSANLKDKEGLPTGRGVTSDNDSEASDSDRSTSEEQGKGIAAGDERSNDRSNKKKVGNSLVKTTSNSTKGAGPVC